jgi:hypothetical protein
MPKRKKEHPPDYRLTVAPHINERTSRLVTLFVLETAQSFAAFRYELTVEEKSEGKAITFRILGLKTPSLSLPSSGQARFSREFENLRGTYTVTIVGLDGNPVTCSLKISEKRVEVVRPPSAKSVVLVTHHSQSKDESLFHDPRPR